MEIPNWSLGILEFYENQNSFFHCSVFFPRPSIIQFSATRAATRVPWGPAPQRRSGPSDRRIMSCRISISKRSIVCI